MKELMPVLKKGDEIRIVSSARKISEKELEDAFIYFYP